MEQPPYHEVADHSCYVVKRHKLLYGLKQTRRKWYDTVSESLTAIGFQKSMTDPAVLFVHVLNDVVILFIHVDNTTMTGSSIDLIRKYEQQIGELFEIMHLGAVSWLLGLTVTQDHSKQMLSISQEAYINLIVHHFNLEDAKPLSTPINSNAGLLKEDCPTSIEDKEDIKNIPYQEIIGALNWLSVGSHPDIAFVMGQLVQFLDKFIGKQPSKL